MLEGEHEGGRVRSVEGRETVRRPRDIPGRRPSENKKRIVSVEGAKRPRESPKIARTQRCEDVGGQSTWGLKGFVGGCRARTLSYHSRLLTLLTSP